MSKVLAVEDDPNILMVLRVRLKAAGHEVVTASDVDTAVETAVRERPDLVLLDVSIPGGGGFEVALRLQAEPATAGTPFVFLTASRQPAFRERAEALGAIAFLEKPYEPAELLRLVDSVREAG